MRWSRRVEAFRKTSAVRASQSRRSGSFNHTPTEETQSPSSPGHPITVICGTRLTTTRLCYVYGALSDAPESMVTICTTPVKLREPKVPRKTVGNTEQDAGDGDGDEDEWEDEDDEI
ncbi:hypothetical protein FIBSPDRAFT_939992 [Athelia psychrophila]|uniref:Uncharacterized protein n=1 Tax=Athelia psychrophila TaxID=1759441 RepID=A0A167WTF9_9AGAM|nr:hypothetical protein FIBSPDRAFT_939992 [Fibularhizoctonia sp. CBS 109695]